MMRHELEERTGPLPLWVWEIAHEVYQNHNAIKDVGGKDQIAEIVKLDMVWYQPLLNWYKEIGGKPVIKEHRVDTYTEYDVNSDGYIVNEVGRQMRDIYKDVQAKLEEKYPELTERLEYFSLSVGYPDSNAVWDTDTHWIAVFYVTGGSEGHYIHVEARKENESKLLFLAKVLDGKETTQALTLALSEIMDV